VVRRGSSITTTRGKPSTPVQDDTSNPFLSPTAGGKNGSVSTSVSGSRSGTNGVATGSVSSARRSSRPYGPSVSDPSFPDPFASPSKSQARIQASGSRSLTSVLRTPGKSTSQQEGQAGSAADGFLFAPSPSRLKSLLEANSLSRSPSKMSPPSGISGNSVGMTGITPRTKARKRLRGEEVEDTPKPRGRGSRGSSGAKGFFGSDGLGRGRSDDEDDDRAEDEDEDEVLGPTPKKGELGRRGNFKTLFGVDEEEDDDFEHDVELVLEGNEKKKKRGEMGDMTAGGTGGMGKMFKKRKIEVGEGSARAKDLKSGVVNGRSAKENGKGKGKELPTNKSTNMGPPSTPRKDTKEVAQSPRSASQVTPLKGKKLAYLAQLDKQDGTAEETDNSEAVPGLNLSPEDRGRIHVEEDLVREIEYSDSDADDGPDPALNEDGMALDAAPRRRTMKVKIEPYRLDQQRRVAAAGGTIKARDLRGGGRQFERTTSSSSTGGKGKIKTVVRNPDVLDEDDVIEQVAEESDETDSLSRLTLRSPENDVLRRTMAYHERKAMAIFSTKAANDLRLRRKGIEIFAAGEGFEGEDDDGEVEDHGRDDEGSEGDDDWDSEPEGWKKVGLGVDDDW
jgi:hypothetical protein